MSILRSLSLLAALLAIGVVGHAADDAVAQRARIERERAGVEARARAGEAACTDRFAVSACLAQVRSERRTALQQLDHQRALLDDAQRKRRAADRQARIRARQDAQAQADEERVAPATRAAARQPMASAPEPGADAATDDSKRRAAVARKRTQAAHRAAAAKQRAEDAALHREAVESRNRERAAQRAPALPLPTPAASASTRP